MIADDMWQQALKMCRHCQVINDMNFTINLEAINMVSVYLECNTLGYTCSNCIEKESARNYRRSIFGNVTN